MGVGLALLQLVETVVRRTFSGAVFCSVSENGLLLDGLVDCYEIQEVHVSFEKGVVLIDKSY